MLLRQGESRSHAVDRRLACILAAIAGTNRLIVPGRRHCRRGDLSSHWHKIAVRDGHAAFHDGGKCHRTFSLERQSSNGALNMLDRVPVLPM